MKGNGDRWQAGRIVTGHVFHFAVDGECLIAAPQPCLLVKRKTRTVGGQLVEYVESICRGDAYVYRLKMLP